MASDLVVETWSIVASHASMCSLSLLIGLNKSARNAVVRHMAFGLGFAGDEVKLNIEQVWARISAVLLQRPMFLTGGAGVGKTFTSTTMLRDLSTWFESPHARVEYARALAAHAAAMEQFARQLAAHEAGPINGRPPPQPPQAPPPPKKLQVLVTASTGAAAQLNGGRTLHSAFNVRIQNKQSNGGRIVPDEERCANELDADATDFLADAHDHDDDDFAFGFRSTNTWAVIVLDGRLRAQLKKLHVLVIDEVSMVDGDLLNLVDQACREARADPRPFGGITMLFVGDFCQLPPVITESERKDGGNHGYAFESRSWLALGPRVVDLVVAVRQHKDSEFFAILTRWRRGDATWRDINWLESRGHHLPNPNPSPHPELGLLLTARCWIRDDRNTAMLERVDGETHARNAAGNPDLCDCYYVRVGGTDPRTGEDYSFHHKDAWVKLPARPNVPNLKHHKKARATFEFKMGARVRCTKNIIEKGGTRRLLVANGSVGTVVGYTRHGGTNVVSSVNVRWDKTSRDGSTFTHTIEPAWFDRTQKNLCLYPVTNERLPLKVVRLQLPLEICYAKTIHSAQGSSIFETTDLCIDDNRNPVKDANGKTVARVAAHGMIYTAVSRFAHEGLMHHIPKWKKFIFHQKNVYCDPVVDAFYRDNAVCTPQWLRDAIA